MSPMLIEQIQKALRENRLEGWLFFDYRRRDPLAYRVLRLPNEAMPTRRWYYFIPATSDPVKLVHRIESSVLDSLPGAKVSYSSWTDQRKQLGNMLQGYSRIAMQYSPDCEIPYVSMVDAGTLELIRSFGVEVVSSGDLIQEFESRWTSYQLETHLRAGRLVDQIRRDAFDLIGERIRTSEPVTEYEVQQFILGRFSQSELTTDHGPIVAVNANASDPHYEPNRGRSSAIILGDLVLIDLWAKLAVDRSVYYDITWTGYCGEVVPDSISEVFEIVKNARQSASNFVLEKARAQESFFGYEVDDVARLRIQQASLGDFFFHRTGHSIGEETHGTGANMDNLESHDTRRVIAHTCFSIEPGVYLREFGIRSEINVFVGEESAQITGEEQHRIVRI